jgi:hypothetical protein
MASHLDSIASGPKVAPPRPSLAPRKPAFPEKIEILLLLTIAWLV